ncbi:hypothetical protein [Sulfurimonas sp.]|uniref:hypothetical protein n=1 Tax=Sulfurimonas sp. TaxID=2022749 RepID=UPI003D0DF1DE
MDIFQTTIKKHFYISMIFFVIGLSFGFYYSINLLGIVINSQMLNPANVRSVHISLMLYGFIPLMLSYLPFLLLYKDLGINTKALRYLEIYSIFWYTFLSVMSISLLMGVTRGLAFYDFHYSLNGILAFAGLFYILALYEYIKEYTQKPLWVKVSLWIVVAAPFVLLFLMNPVVGQVESTVSGPHGDNTLGMSFALIPIYYLIFKLLSTNEFKARWHILWIIPGAFYVLSVMYRMFIGHLTYDQEWFFQWLTFLYVPLLIRWYKDAQIPKTSKTLLLISIVGFLFVDIEGNILFIESIRWVFHRNDLVVAHAHIAMGVGVLLMTLSMYANIIEKLQKPFFVRHYLYGMFGIFIALSLNGFVEAGYFHFDSTILWSIRSISGIFIISSFFYFIVIHTQLSKLQLYNVIGLLSDGFGGILLILVANWLYPLLGFSFSGTYEYIVFGFVTTTGLLHYFALKKENSEQFTLATAIIRFFVSGIFLALFLAGKLGLIALGIFGFDFIYASIFFIWFYQPKYMLKEKNV